MPRCFFFNDTATTEIYTLSLHDALPILPPWRPNRLDATGYAAYRDLVRALLRQADGLRIDHVAGLWRLWWVPPGERSEEHTSELQSRQYLVCRLLLEKKKNKTNYHEIHK